MTVVMFEKVIDDGPALCTAFETYFNEKWLPAKGFNADQLGEAQQKQLAPAGFFPGHVFGAGPGGGSIPWVFLTCSWPPPQAHRR